MTKKEQANFQAAFKTIYDPKKATKKKAVWGYDQNPLKGHTTRF